MSNAEVALLIAAVVVGVPMYFLPSVVANTRRHKNYTGVTMLNLFLGWTLVGWVLALVWASLEGERGAPRKKKTPAPLSLDD